MLVYDLNTAVGLLTQSFRLNARKGIRGKVEVSTFINVVYVDGLNLFEQDTEAMFSTMIDFRHTNLSASGGEVESRVPRARDKVSGSFSHYPILNSCTEGSQRWCIHRPSRTKL